MSKRREVEGIKLLAEGDNLKQQNQSDFLVRSQSNPNVWYRVRWQEGRWICDCPDYFKNRVKCKHIYAVCYYQALGGILRAVEGSAKEGRCPRCGLSDLVIKRGFRYNRSGPVQIYCCKRCGIKFAGRTAFWGMKKKAMAIVAALDLYFRGLSLRQVAEHLETTHGIKVSHATIHNWLKKYVELVNLYVKTLNFSGSGRWHVDETLVRVRGRHAVLWGLLDGETRLLVATHISQGRGERDARVLLRKGIELSKSPPREVVTDGLPSYALAIQKECQSRGLVVHLQGPLSEALNNKMERFFGTVKSRARAARMFGSEEGVRRFAEGFAVYYNFMRAHAALNGKTPAQVADLERRKSGWLDMIMAAKKCEHLQESKDKC